MVLLFCIALILALAIDRWLGEPLVRFHPVVWIGNYLGWAGARIAPLVGSNRPQAQDFKAFSLGVLVWTAGAATVFVVAWMFQRTCFWLLDLGWMGLVGAAILLGLALKPMLAFAMLKSEVLAVEAALGQSLSTGRERLSWLVSRDVTTLTEAQVRESAIESLAENLNDSVIAPIFWFILLGLPGAALYRFANTADAMWGYPGDYNGRHWQWAGKWAARVDDVLSWVPARITAGLLALVAPTTARMSLAALRVEAAHTPSPNSGWPMAAMALALDVCLHKPGVYVLNASGRAPESTDTLKAILYASKVVQVPVVIALLAIIFVVIGMIR
jgi:adenosylcobinamide-phosphate synthase